MCKADFRRIVLMFTKEEKVKAFEDDSPFGKNDRLEVMKRSENERSEIKTFLGIYEKKFIRKLAKRTFEHFVALDKVLKTIESNSIEFIEMCRDNFGF